MVSTFASQETVTDVGGAYCGGEGTVEIEYGSQAGREEPRTRTVQCAECRADDREPDEYDNGFRYADEGHYAGEGRP